MSYTWDCSYTPTFTTTIGSTMSGLSGMTISASDRTDCSYTIQLGDTTLETKDIDFLHSLQQINPDCAAALAQIINDFKEQDWSTYSWTGNMRKNIQENKEEEEKDMDILKNFNFGSCGDRAKISHLGVAVKNLNGEWVSYDKNSDEIVNVDLISFGDRNLVYMIPVAIKDINIGDVICHNKHIMFVKKIKEDGLVVIDVTAGEIKKILPTKNIFGFDFVTKLVSLIDLSGLNASSDNPFGNLLPFLLLSDNKEDMLPLMLMMNGNNLDMSNPFMLMTFLNSNGNTPISDLISLMYMMNLNKEK